MKKLLLSPIFFLAFVCNASAQISSYMDARLQFVLDSMCTTYNIKGASAAVLIPQGGLWKGVYGESYAGQPITSDMYFGIGSNTKPYIASMMLKLQEDGLLDLDDTIGTWIQGYNNVNGQVTIRQMLNHTSGLYNFTNNPLFTSSLNNDFTAVWQPEQIIQQFVYAPSFAPGASWEYSNTNYVLAGLIIKAVLSTPVYSALHDSILVPQGLNNTVYFPFETPGNTVPHVWSKNFGQPYLVDAVVDYGYDHTAMFSMGGAAGAIMSTAEDNVIFWNKLMTGNIINSASMQEMKTFIPLSGTKGYGLGLFRTTNYNTSGRTVFHHGGTNIGFINDNIVDSITGVCISVLTNQDSLSNSILFAKVIAALHKETLKWYLSVENTSAQNTHVTIYPNPAHSEVNISVNSSEELEMQVYDIAGKEMKRKQVKGKATVSLEGLNNGLYLVYLSNKNGERVHMSKLSVY